jgi:hypothetical protein
LPRATLASGATVRLTAAQQQLIATLRQPPVYAAAQPLWYQCKALELAVTFLLQPPPEDGNVLLAPAAARAGARRAGDFSVESKISPSRRRWKSWAKKSVAAIFI